MALRFGHAGRTMVEWPLLEALGLRRAPDSDETSTYKVFVRDLLLTCSIGIYDFEKRMPQRVRVNVELDVCGPGMFRGEDFAQVLNYETIVDGIKDIAASGHIELVETFAERIAALCLGDVRVEVARVTVEKLDIYPDAEGVGVGIVRRRASTGSAR
jgi:dihydroneopterin aldolase